MLQWCGGKVNRSGVRWGIVGTAQMVLFCNMEASGRTLFIKPFKASLRIWHRLEQWELAQVTPRADE